jgi:predicted phosphate transport protein (TIGR00153 family)
MAGYHLIVVYNGHAFEAIISPHVKERGRMKILPRKKQNRFLELLIKQAEFTVEGMQALLSYVKKPNEGLAQKVTHFEKDADEVRRILIDELNRTFVTPFDREDIFALSLTIDDVLDYANTTVEEMHMLDITPNVFIERIVSLLNDAAREIYMGVLQLEDHPNVANDHAVRAKALENRVETVYREAIADLFQMPRDIDHVVEMLKLREIYRHLSNAADQGDQAANVIADIVVKKM